MDDLPAAMHTNTSPPSSHSRYPPREHLESGEVDHTDVSLYVCNPQVLDPSSYVVVGPEPDVP